MRGIRAKSQRIRLTYPYSYFANACATLGLLQGTVVQVGWGALRGPFCVRSLTPFEVDLQNFLAHPI